MRGREDADVAVRAAPVGGGGGYFACFAFCSGALAGRFQGRGGLKMYQQMVTVTTMKTQEMQPPNDPLCGIHQGKPGGGGATLTCSEPQWGQREERSSPRGYQVF